MEPPLFRDHGEQEYAEELKESGYSYDEIAETLMGFEAACLIEEIEEEQEDAEREQREAMGIYGED